MKPLHLLIIIILVWIIAGKIMIYLARLWAWREEMEYRRKWPHATAAPAKPKFFNHTKSKTHGKKSK
jgi:hypothetical protein